MPYDATPSNTTYQTKQIKLIKELNNRGSDTSKDEDLVNIFPELVKNKDTGEQSFKLVKRDGCSLYITPPGTVRGGFYWKDLNRIFLAISDDVYIYNGTTGALLTTLNTVYSTTSGKVGFCNFLYDDGTVKIVTTDGTQLSTIDAANAVAPSVDLDLPLHIPTPIFLDGYLFIIKIDTADIYNSNLNDPLLWTAGDFIACEMKADKASYLTSLNNYIVAFGTESIEYFWDAGNASGSPLQRNDTPIKLNTFLGGVAIIASKLYFVGADDYAQPNVFLLEDFKIKPVGNEAIRRHLSSLSGTFDTDLKGNIISIGGHDFYIIDTGISTYALEIENGLWSRWTFKQTTRFPISFCFNILNTTIYQSLVISNNLIYKFSPTLYQDDNVNFTCMVVTDKNSFDTYRQKFMGRLIAWTNKTATSAYLLVQWTDNDYQTFNTGLSIDISKERPTIYRLGAFRERAFKLSFTENFPLLLQGLEVDVNMGNS